MIQTIQRIYGYLRYWGYVRNQYEFSQRWLGQCASYFSMMKARNAGPCAEALLVLLARLRDHSERLKAAPECRSNDRMWQLQLMLQREADAIADHLYQTSLKRVAAQSSKHWDGLQ
jgi:hypothetical protein